MDECHLKPLFEVHEKIEASNPMPEGSYYFVGGVNDVTGSRKARKGYYDRIMQWYKKHPFKMYIFYGANRFLSAAINIASPFAPFPVRTVKDLNSALKYIAGKESNIQDPQLSKKAGNRDQTPFHTTNQYVDELLLFLGSSNWETDGYDESIKLRTSE